MQEHNSCHNVPTAVASATPICYLRGAAMGQPVTGQLATHPSNTTVKIQMHTDKRNYSSTDTKVRVKLGKLVRFGAVRNIQADVNVAQRQRYAL